MRKKSSLSLNHQRLRGAASTKGKTQQEKYRNHAREDKRAYQNRDTNKGSLNAREGGIC